MLLILILSAYLRFVGLTTWDGDTFQHPDERFLVFTVNNIALPASFGDYLRSNCDTNGSILNPLNPAEPAASQEPSRASGCNTLNPRNYNWSRFFVYGPLPTTLNRLVAELRGATSPDAIRSSGRVLAALFDLGSVVLVFLIGRRLYGRAVGLTAALLMALTVLHIQHAHFFTVDAFSAFFTLLALYWAVRAAQGGGSFDFAMLGLAIGAGMAVRLTLAVLGLLGIIAAIYAFVAHPQSQAQTRPSRSLLIGWQPEDGQPQTRVFAVPLAGPGALRQLALLVLAGSMTLLTFRLLQPDAFIGTSFFDVRPEPRFLESMQTASLTVSGEVDMPPSHQWTGRADWWFPWQNMVLWGMGLPLGLAAWVGWALAGWQLIRRGRGEHLLLWFWVTFWFVWQGAQFVLTQRYLLPIYGPLIILAAWLLVRVTSYKLRGANSTLLRALPLVLVVGGTLLWSYAFTRIYTRPHSRIEASRWIYANVPPGAAVTSEEWDDGLPVSVDGYNYNHVVSIQTKPYWEDAPEKFFTTNQSNELGLIDQLDLAEYVVLSSNRVYDSVERLPMRFPATLRYYQSLFNGELGFELVADIGSYPTLFGIPINDQLAEEAFSVYDHPRVLIFKKTDAFSREKAAQLLTEGIAWSEIYRLRPIKADQAPTALRLSAADWPRYRSSGTWAALFDPASLSNQFPVLAWLLTLELLGLAVFALLWRPLAALPDCGFALAKLLALVLVAYGAWLLGSFRLMAFTPASVWLCGGMLLATGGLVGWYDRQALGAFVRRRRSALLWAQGLFLAAFFGMLLVRFANPDLWHPARGGEKPMDFAFLNGVLKSGAFPPYDPWFAGGYLNYYYFGFVIVGTLIHLTGIVPEVAYNLAVPTLFALTALGAWGVVYNLKAAADRQPARADKPANNGRRRDGQRERGAIASGLLAAVLVTLAGNLAQALFFVSGYAADNRDRPEWAFWDATRIVDGAINEFPFFTFLFADLHAHMIVLPLTLAALGLMVALVRLLGTAKPAPPMRLFVIVGLLALLIGAMRATNTWEYPTYLLLSLTTLLLLASRGWMRGIALRDLAWTYLPAAALLLVLPSLLFLPFVRSFGTDYQGIEIWHAERTSLHAWLRLNGLWLTVLGVAAVVLLGRVLTQQLTLFVGTMLALTVGLALLVGALTPAVVLLAPLLLAALLLGLLLLTQVSGNRQQAATMAARPLPVAATTLWALLIAGTALALSLAVEVVRIQGDIGRMNTVFKFGLQGWTLAALATALAMPWLWRQARRWPVALRWSWAVLNATLLAAALVYPLTATPARIADRMVPATPYTLDGLAFAEAASMDENGQRFDLAGDMAAIRWLRQNVSGSPVILEGHTEAYRWGSRISVYTGLPTILGWPWHETQQRAVVEISPIIGMRQQAIFEIYGSDDARAIKTQLQRYGVEYLVVGGLEEALYSGARQRMAALAATGALELAFDGPTQIYRVAPDLVRSPQVLHSTVALDPPPISNPVTLMLDRPTDQLPPLDEYAWNPLARSPWVATLLWMVVLYGLTLLGLPLAALAFGHWRDGGWSWARLLGLLLLGYAVWMPVSARLWIFDRWSLLWALLLILALNSWALWRIARRDGEQLVQPAAAFGPLLDGSRRGLGLIIARLHECRSAVVQSELLFLAAFGLALGLRLFNPDLWHPFYGGEKPFEFGFINAILRSPLLPPLDPFYSGGYINYYYYGLFLVALPIKLTGIAPAVGFNLALPTLYGLLAGAAFALAAQVGGRARYGLLAAMSVALLGNLAATLTPGPEINWQGRGLAPVIAALQQGGLNRFGERLGDWFWGPTRVIPFTINEFPFFSFLFADLHPHVVALPITLLAVALAWNLVGSSRAQTTDKAGLFAGTSFQFTFALVPLVLGTLAVTNSWDFPTYSLLIGAALVGGAYRANRATGSVRSLVSSALLAIGLPLLGLVLFLPFFQHFRAFVRGIGQVQTGSPAASYLLLYGVFVALVAPLLWLMALRVLRYRARMEPPRPAPGGLGIVPLARTRWPSLGSLARNMRVLTLLTPTLLALLLIVLPQERLRIVLAALLLLSAGLLLERRLSAAAWFAALLASAAWGVSLGIETIFIRDHLAGGDWERMNTVFKFGLQIWVLLALAAAFLMPLLVRGLRRIGLLSSLPVIMLAVTLLLATLVYPLVGTFSRLATRFATTPVPTLDGLAFMPDATFCLPTGQPTPANPTCPPAGFDNHLPIELGYDHTAIAWLNANIAGAPVVLQSEREFYRAYGIRIAANTGLPTVVGALHSDEQRPPEEVAQRVADAQAIFSTSDEALALRLLAKYGVNYVYIGLIERALYDPQGLAKFDRWNGSYLSLVYENGGVKIFRVSENVRQIGGALQAIELPNAQQLAQPQPETPAEPLNLPPAAQADPTDNGNAPAPAQPIPADLAELERLVAANPRDADLAYALGQRYRDLSRAEDAAPVLEYAAQYNPLNIGLHHLWGDVLADVQRYDEAAAAYRKAAEAAPTAGNYNKLGSALLIWGRAAAAEQALLEAVKIDVNEPDPHYFLGKLYQQRGETTKALTEFEAYLRLARPGAQYWDDATAQAAILRQ